MAGIALKGPELKKMVKIAKKRDLNFAYCPGNDPKEDVFVLDRKKKPEVMGRVARAEGTGSKLGYGTARAKGRIMMMTCERELPQMAKKLKKLLKFEKLPMNVIVMDKDGKILEEDIEELEPDPELDAEDDDGEENEADEAAENDEEDDNDPERLKKLTARAQQVKTGIADLPNEAQAPLTKGFGTVLGGLKSGDLDAADNMLTRLEEALEKLAAKGNDAAPEDPALARLRQAADQLEKRIGALENADGAARLMTAHGMLVGQIGDGDVKKATGTVKALNDALTRAEGQGEAAEQKPEADAVQDDNATDAGMEWRDARADLEPVALDLLARNLGDVTKLRAVLAYFTEKGEAEDYAGAMKAVPGLKKLIAEAEADQLSAAEKDIPANVVPFVRARLDWVKTRSTLRAELTKLQDAIVSACDEEEFPDIANASDHLFSYIKNLDGRLENALEALVQEPDGEKREKLKADAAGLLAEFQTELDNPFFQIVDDGNGFKAVNIRAAAMESLGKVRAALTEAA
ncbi:hypothetical protein [uncultured Tateyamaria sp.]|uniref:hypothetical protein n=1 Tax=uncultured Tateyamaria sp. TaxID=455651 RepID=UPI002608CD91|nr:hypothetical protein [uncultured Tateyamaria sp.]